MRLSGACFNYGFLFPVHPINLKKHYKKTIKYGFLLKYLTKNSDQHS